MFFSCAVSPKLSIRTSLNASNTSGLFFSFISLLIFLIIVKDVKWEPSHKFSAKGNKHKQTPLHFACKGHLQIVQYLIEKGADMEAKDRDEQTPLHIACI